MALFWGGLYTSELHSSGPIADSGSHQNAMPTLQPPISSLPLKPNTARTRPATPFVPAIPATEAVQQPAAPEPGAGPRPQAGTAGLSPVDVLPGQIHRPQCPPSAKQTPLQPRGANPPRLLPTRPSAPLDIGQPPRLLASTEKAALLFQPRYAFALSGGLNSQVHTYRPACSPAGKENARPGFYLSTRYQRNLGKGFHLAATARYSVHHSRFSGEHRTYSSSINLLNEELRTVKTTFYALYNRYSRADLSLGVGKTWESEGLAFSLGVSAGYSWWAQREGSYLGPNGQIERITGAGMKSGGWAFGLHTAIFRPLSQHIAIGIEASATAPLLLYQTEGGCAQRAAPLAFGILLRRQ